MNTPSLESMAEVMTCIKWCCDLAHTVRKALHCNGSDYEQSSELKAHTLLPSHQPVALLYDQQGHHPLTLDLTSYIPSKLIDAKG